MTASVILTVLGSDRPGLTQRLAEAVHAAGGNWLNSHLARLGGKYVGAVLVEIADADRAKLEAAVRAIDPAMLSVTLVDADADAPPAGTRMLTISLTGADRPGIVREMTTALAAIGVNIEALESGAESGAWTGERIFRARAELRLPAEANSEDVSRALEAISGEIMVDIAAG